MTQLSAALKVSLLTGLALLAATLAGCKSSYALDVRNASAQPVYVAMLSRNDAGTLALGQTRLGPGDRGGLGPFTVARSEIVWAQFDTQPNPERAPEMTLRPGLSVIEVTQDSNAAASPLRVREIGGSAR